MRRAKSLKTLACDACGEPLHASGVGPQGRTLAGWLLIGAAVAWFAAILWPGGATARWSGRTAEGDEDFHGLLLFLLAIPGLALLGVGLGLPRVRDLTCDACGGVTQVRVRFPAARRGAERRQEQRKRRLRLSDESKEDWDWD